MFKKIARLLGRHIPGFKGKDNQIYFFIYRKIFFLVYK